MSRSDAARLVAPPVALVATRPRPVDASGARRRLWPLLGPAFVAAVAYVDPGNFATNSSAGASFGYRLLWVIVAANLLAMLVQTLTAKLGLATCLYLATLCRQELPWHVVRWQWVQFEWWAYANERACGTGGS